MYNVIISLDSNQGVMLSAVQNDKGAKRTGNKEDSSSEEETDDETDAEEDVEPQAAQKAVKVSGPTKEAGQQAKSSEEESSGSSSGEEDDSSDDDSEEESDTEPNGGAKAEKEAKGQARAVKRKMSFGQATDEEQDQGKHKKAKSLSTKQVSPRLPDWHAIAKYSWLCNDRHLVHLCLCLDL